MSYVFCVCVCVCVYVCVCANLKVLTFLTLQSKHTMYTFPLHIKLILTGHDTRVPIPKLYTNKCILYIIYILE